MKSFFNTHKQDLIIVLLIISISTIAWEGVLNQIMEGEGFIYFSPSFSLFLPNGNLANLNGYENFPRVFHYVMQKLVGGDIQPYMNFLFVTILAVNILIYYFVKIFSHSRLIAFFASIYAGVNYLSDFQFYARGHYQWFIGRVPEIIPVIFSFILIYFFIKTAKYKFYLLSLVLFILALYMSHFATYLTTFIPLFFFFNAIINKANKKQITTAVLYGVPFLIINYIVLSNSPLTTETLRPNESFLQFVLNTQDLVYKMSYQLVVITIPLAIIKPVLDTLSINPSYLIPQLIIPVYIFYILVFLLIYKKRVSLLNLNLSSFGVLMVALFLNVYLKRFNPFNDIFQGRYFYISAIFVGIILGSFFYSLITAYIAKKRPTLKILLIVLLVFIWSIPNIQLIKKQIHDSQYIYTGGRILLDYLLINKDHLPEGAHVMLPNPLMPLGEDYLKKHYNNGKNIRFLFIDTKWKTRLPENFDKNKLFVFNFNEEFKRGGNARVEFISIVDESEQYRNQLP